MAYREHTSKLPWVTVFPYALWSLGWRSSRAAEYFPSSPPTKSPVRSIPVWVSWRPLSEWWNKLNTLMDRHVEIRAELEAGGVTHGMNWSWTSGFDRHPGVTTGFIAELWAIRDGPSISDNCASAVGKEFHWRFCNLGIISTWSQDAPRKTFNLSWKLKCQIKRGKLHQKNT